MLNLNIKLKKINVHLESKNVCYSKEVKSCVFTLLKTLPLFGGGKMYPPL